MQTSELSGRLRQWSHEFAAIRGDPITVPEGLWAFLAARVAEHSDAAQPDPDTIRVLVMGEWRTVRPVGTHPGALLRCDHADGSIGTALCPVKDVHEGDRGKLSRILERLMQDGRIRAG